MALVVISGYGCSGKTTRAHELEKYLTERQSLPVRIVSDETVKTKRSAYDDSKYEKPARAALLSAVVSHTSKNQIVICDGMNYLKSLRYQYYCTAREASAFICTIHVAAPPAECERWNSQRPPELQYKPETLENLFQRYEEPNNAVRWDSPLFFVPWSDDSLPLDKIFEAITSGKIKPQTTATLPNLVNSMSYLQKLETTTSTVITHISNLPVYGGQTTIKLKLPSVSTPIEAQIILPSNKPPPSKMQRLKRQFIQINKQTREELSCETIARLFIDYLQNNM